MNTVLEELDVSHNSLGSYGAKIIRAALMERSMLQHSLNNTLAIEHNTESSNLLKCNLDDQSRGSRSNSSPQSVSSSATSDYEHNHNNHDNSRSTTKRRKRKRNKKNKQKQNEDGNGNGNEENDDEKAVDLQLQRHDKASSSQPSLLDKKSKRLSLSPCIDRRAKSSIIRSPYRPNKQLLEKWMTPSQLSYIQSQLGIWINFEGNFLKEEVFNSITHGLGFLLSVIASTILMNFARDHSIRCQIACAVFSFTLFFMYLSS
eukprot:116358_1